MSRHARQPDIDRRRWLRQAALGAGGCGLGAAALADLLGAQRGAGTRGARPAGDPLAAQPPHFAPRARAVIFLGMIGAPSQVDLFAHKPELDRRDGEPLPPSLLAGERFAFLDPARTSLLASPWRKAQAGDGGVWLSELLPAHRAIADEVAWVHAMHTDEFNHVPAQRFLYSGFNRAGRPPIGSWVVYGLGSPNRDLPAYVVLASGKAGRCGSSCWSSGFLPGVYQGVQLRAEGDPVPFLEDPDGLPRALRRRTLDATQALNRRRLEELDDPALATRIEAAELAFRMQASVPELLDLRGEGRATLDLYGADPDAPSFARNCLLARRLVERGTRFVQLVHGGWDHHGGTGDQNLLTDLPRRAREVDRASAALVLDLRARGLLDEVVVVWTGEFGRTPMLQGPRDGRQLGRDHQRTAWTLWIAGGGVRAGVQHGATDDLGIRAVAGAVHVHDLQATLLHVLGLDHERLTFRHAGRHFRLTDVGGRVVRELLA